MAKFEAQIPYHYNLLSPFLSEETLAFHHGKHHTGYAEKLNKLIIDSEYREQNLEEIIINSRSKDFQIFNQAAQLFNHNFYWQCLKKDAPPPKNKLKKLIQKQFYSFENFSEQYIHAANSLFGSGWSWLICNGTQLSFLQTTNAENPLGSNQKILCVVDLWEHAYYIDYRNNRIEYLKKLIKNNINWEFCEKQL